MQSSPNVKVKKIKSVDQSSNDSLEKYLFEFLGLLAIMHLFFQKKNNMHI